MRISMTAAPAAPILDEHSVLLWQTCAYADDLTDAARSMQPLGDAYDAMLEFLHYRLLPYLTEEERRLPETRLRDERMRGLLLADHERLRDDVGNLEGSHTRRRLALTADALVDRLDRHVGREETWVADHGPEPATEVDQQGWALSLLFAGDIDLDALPARHRERMVLQRLTWMRPGEVVRLQARGDLHPLWRRQNSRSPDSHVWVYELEGPGMWRARVTRRSNSGD